MISKRALPHINERNGHPRRRDLCLSGVAWLVGWPAPLCCGLRCEIAATFQLATIRIATVSLALGARNGMLTGIAHTGKRGSSCPNVHHHHHHRIGF
eukprot:6214741-Pleurochrysis_carterae.AAC.1